MTRNSVERVSKYPKIVEATVAHTQGTPLRDRKSEFFKDLSWILDANGNVRQNGTTEGALSTVLSSREWKDTLRNAYLGDGINYHHELVKQSAFILNTEVSCVTRYLVAYAEKGEIRRILTTLDEVSLSIVKQELEKYVRAKNVMPHRAGVKDFLLDTIKTLYKRQKSKQSRGKKSKD